MVFFAKNSGRNRLPVASHETALAPFSQNSKEEVSFGSGHAQPGQSKPCGWFTLCKAMDSRAIAICPLSARATAPRAPHPPAAPSYASIPGTSLSLIAHSLLFDPPVWPFYAALDRAPLSDTVGSPRQKGTGGRDSGILWRCRKE